jgi:hypothetical protein
VITGGTQERVRPPRPWRARRTIAALCLLGLAAAPLTSCSRIHLHLHRLSGPLIYYVSPAGNDHSAGTSPGEAWRTLSRASAAILRPGARLLLEGGKQFTGQLRFGRGDAGAPAKPAIVGSYGRGRATIVSPNDSGIVIYDTGGIDVSDLVVRGTHSPHNGLGINLYSDLKGNQKPGHVTIERVDVSGFYVGISIGSGSAGNGFRDVQISDSTVHDNVDAGVMSYGPTFNPAAPKYANDNIAVSRVTVFGNHGDPAKRRHNSGSGIVLGSVQGATVSWSVAHDNGGSGGDRYQGPQGIWAYDSTSVVIEHSLSYHNKTRYAVDGGGFDLDQNVSHSVLQYNLSYGNDGAGLLLYTGAQNDTYTDNVARFNISSSDARAWQFYGGITVIGRISHTSIYQNTVIAVPRSDGTPALAVQIGRGLKAITMRNNIFVTYQAGPILVSRLPYPRSALLLQGNDYYSASGSLTIRWAASNYYSLAQWRPATGQETRPGKETGFEVNPGLVRPVIHLTLTQPSFRNGAAFQLRAGSAMVGSGLDLWHLFRIERGPVNFSGRPLAGTTPNIGAQ